MSKNLKTKLNVLLLLASTTFAVQSKHYFDFADDMFSTFEDIQEAFENQRKEFAEHIASLYPSKAERKALKKSGKELTKIKPSVTQKDNNVIISFDISNVDKNGISEIDLNEKRQVASGSIKTESGRIEYIITPNSFGINRYAETKKEEPAKETQAIREESEKAKETKVTSEESEKAVTSSYYYSSASQMLPAAVDLNGIELMTKDNKLTIIIPQVVNKKIAPKHL